MIISNIKAAGNLDYEERVRSTMDRVFLLSENEVLMYFDSDSESAAQTTEYVGALH